MSVEFYRESPGKFDSRTLSREILVGGLRVALVEFFARSVSSAPCAKFGSEPMYHVISP